MKTKAFICLTSALLLGAGLLIGTANVAAETWTLQTSTPAGSAITKHMEEWAKKLAIMTDNAIEIQLAPAGAVVPYNQTMDAIAQGILQGDLTSTVYFGGRDKAFAIMGDLISGYDTPWQFFSYCYQGGGKELLQEIFDNFTGGQVRVVGCAPSARESFTSSIEIKGVDVLQGVKIRSPEGLAAEVFKRAGATPVGLPASEVYTSLQKGVIQAADYSSYTEDKSVGMHEIAKYPIYPGIHSMPVLQFTVNKSKWDGLSEAQQLIVDSWYRAMLVDLIQKLELCDRELVATDTAAGDIHVIDWSREERDKLRAIAAGAWKDFSEGSELAKKAYESHMAFMKKLGLVD
jgi:TRAP-type mannitol/chloroaromatic compound transport system substrate-binding protein